MPPPMRAKKSTPASTASSQKSARSLRHRPARTSEVRSAKQIEREQQKRARSLERNAKKRAAYAKRKLDQVEAAAKSIASVNAIVDRNICCSAFLRLPSEIRIRIFALAAGGFHIRIEPVRPENWLPCPSASWADRPRTRKGGFWNHCYDDGDFSRAPGQGGDTLTSLGNNEQVLTKYREKWPISRETYRALTGVRRQIYYETALMQYPYRLNSFSFYNYNIMQKWVKRLKSAQKQAITRVVLPEGPESIRESTRKSLKGLTAVYMPKTHLNDHKSEKARWESEGIRVIEYEPRSEVRAEVADIKP